MVINNSCILKNDILDGQHNYNVYDQNCIFLHLGELHLLFQILAHYN